MRIKNKQSSSGTLSDEVQCLGFQELKNWQVTQYRSTVDNHRTLLSRQQGRCVAWQEAEQDFCENSFDNHAEEWRVEYCGLICPSRNSCLLALHFMRSKDTEPLHKTG